LEKITEIQELLTAEKELRKYINTLDKFIQLVDTFYKRNYGVTGSSIDTPHLKSS